MAALASARAGHRTDSSARQAHRRNVCYRAIAVSNQQAVEAPAQAKTEFVAETLLPTKTGKFRLRGYRHTVRSPLCSDVQGLDLVWQIGSNSPPAGVSGTFDHVLHFAG